MKGKHTHSTLYLPGPSRREDMGWGREDRKEQGPLESYGESPMPHEGQRGLSQYVPIYA